MEPPFKHTAKSGRPSLLISDTASSIGSTPTVKSTYGLKLIEPDVVFLQMATTPAPAHAVAISNLPSRSKSAIFKLIGFAGDLNIIGVLEKDVESNLPAVPIFLYIYTESLPVPETTISNLPSLSKSPSSIL